MCLITNTVSTSTVFSLTYFVCLCWDQEIDGSLTSSSDLCRQMEQRHLKSLHFMEEERQAHGCTAPVLHSPVGYLASLTSEDGDVLRRGH